MAGRSPNEPNEDEDADEPTRAHTRRGRGAQRGTSGGRGHDAGEHARRGKDEDERVRERAREWPRAATLPSGASQRSLQKYSAVAVSQLLIYNRKFTAVLLTPPKRQFTFVYLHL